MTGLRQGPDQSVHATASSATAMYNANRQPPLFEFNAGRLFLDPNNPATRRHGAYPGIPGYYDYARQLAAGRSDGINSSISTPTSAPTATAVYDPNDVNFADAEESDGSLPTRSDRASDVPARHRHRIMPSPSPNPYTTDAAPMHHQRHGRRIQKPQTFQIISSGVDGLYGVGGQYIAARRCDSSASNSLPFDAINTAAGSQRLPTARCDDPISASDDNLTNFKSGTFAIIEPVSVSVATWSTSGGRCRSRTPTDHRRCGTWTERAGPMRETVRSSMTTTGLDVLRRRRASERRGFTLVELLVVMVIIAIILGFVLIAADGCGARAEERATQTPDHQARRRASTTGSTP